MQKECDLRHNKPPVRLDPPTRVGEIRHYRIYGSDGWEYNLNIRSQARSEHGYWWRILDGEAVVGRAQYLVGLLWDRGSPDLWLAARDAGGDGVEIFLFLLALGLRLDHGGSC